MVSKGTYHIALSLVFWLLHLSLLAVLFMPQPSFPFAFSNIDKVVHVLLFIPVSCITFLYLGGKKIPVAIGLSFYAFLLEVGQSLFTTTRLFDWGDWAMGITGVVIGMGIVHLFSYMKR